MEIQDSTDKSKITTQDSIDKVDLQRKLQDAPEARPVTNFRYFDRELGGEIHTSTSGQESIQAIVTAKVVRPDGSSEMVGSTRYRVSDNEASIVPGSFTAHNYGVEGALLDEVAQQSREQGADHLRVWIENGDSAAERQWLAHSFHSTEPNPGASGVHWEKPL